ncbi:hypothetical protein HPP92_027779 [Vanilla planifolia]|uniref:protein-serine/threonine phosphatase n=1 Tax=Vanilla planifolia TaxID=51239 RepID=A0A835U5G0_VANPL|nr:hypothetical protein HPP92_027779 [Vanilla planifolia]
MLGSLMRLLSRCWGPAGGTSAGGGRGEAVEEGRNGLLWYRHLGCCAGGEFSMAVVQANQVLEDQSQIESGPFGTFVGIYDGHGGPEAARYVCDNLFRNFRVNLMSDDIRRAFLTTEEGFIELVSRLWNTRPGMATTGSCCLVGIIREGTLFIANIGDSRVVLGRKIGNTNGISSIQLSTEHNANSEAVRQELRGQHPNDPQIVVLRHGVWRVKGIIQVSRSIGDAYLKQVQYNREPINEKFRISGPVSMPILTANPAIICHPLQQSDSFLIFASDGLWEHLSNETAVEIVHNHPRTVRGIAKRLIKAALQEAARSERCDTRSETDRQKRKTTFP